MSSKFIIIYDTYCGWCYGADPIFQALAAENVEIETLHRHLFQGPYAYKMSEGKGDHIMLADAQIAKLSGQYFSQTYIENVVRSNSEVLESGLSAQAAALVHSKGARAELALAAKLQKTRYVDGVSAANRSVVVETLIEEGVSPSDAEKIGTPELATKAKDVSIKATELMDLVGARGVPTLLQLKDDQYQVINHSAFYTQPEMIRQITL